MFNLVLGLYGTDMVNTTFMTFKYELKAYFEKS